MIEKGFYDIETLDQVKKNLMYGEIHKLMKYGWLNDDTKFKNLNTLGNALSRMKKINIIDTQPDDSGYDYYIPTILGIESFDRWYLNWYIFNFCPSEKLDELRNLIMKFI